jgi:hypothetical protein
MASTYSNFLTPFQHFIGFSHDLHATTQCQNGLTETLAPAPKLTASNTAEFENEY